MFRRKKRFGAKRAPMSGDMELQITSMADIFTILLVFLLKSYATGAANITPDKGMTLPQAQNTDSSAVEALKLHVSKEAVQIEGAPVAALKEFAFDPADLGQNGVSTALSAALKRERDRQLLIAKANSDVKVDPKIIVVSDQETPYSTIKTVLASAAVNGYTDFKLAVIKGE